MRQGQTCLQDLVERQGIPVFDQIPAALACVNRVLREDLRPQDLSREDNVNPVKIANIQLGDKLVKLQEVFDSLDVNNTGEISLSDMRSAFRIMTGEELSVDCLRAIAIGQMDASKEELQSQYTTCLDDIRVNFDEFCCIVTEFKSQLDSNSNLLNALSGKVMLLVNPLSRVMEWIWRPLALNDETVHRHHQSEINSVQAAPAHRPILFETQYRDIYLGGSGYPNWREDIAIPILK